MTNHMKIATLGVFVFALSLISGLAKAANNSSAIKQALESYPTCGNFVRYDELNVYLGFGQYRTSMKEPRKPIPGELKIIPISNPSSAATLNTPDAAIDSVSDGDSLFVLTYSGIEEWSLSKKTLTATYATFPGHESMSYMEHAQGFARYSDTLIIAHGRLGVSFFNLKTKRIENKYRLIPSQGALESAAMDVTVQGKYAYINLDQFSLVSTGKQAFSGIVTVDMDTQTVVSELGGMDVGSDAVVSDGTKLIVSFWGLPIWKYRLGDLHASHGTSIPEPELRMWQFPIAGHPTGKPAMDDVNYYTCFYEDPAHPGGSYKRAPLAIDRHMMHLD